MGSRSRAGSSQTKHSAGGNTGAGGNAGADGGAGGSARLLVLLHGLGETTDERAGAYAWIERYGLGTAYERLRYPPVVRTARREDMTDARLAEIHAQLGAKPFGGLAIVCPYLPNVRATHTPLDDVARWIVETVVPRARAESGLVATDPVQTDIDGCSLGGYVALETFLRRPEAFGAVGGVQSAVGERQSIGVPLRGSIRPRDGPHGSAQRLPCDELTRSLSSRKRGTARG